MQTIVTVPDPVLRKKSNTIEMLDKKLMRFLHDLGITLIKKDDPPGVGISAVQVGKPLRAFYTRMPEDHSQPLSSWHDDQMQLTLYVNPTITDQSSVLTTGSRKKKPDLEGCLSIPKIWGPILRPEWVEISFLTLPLESLVTAESLSDFTEMKVRYHGFAGRVIQHEYDHLDGVLFTDYWKRDGLPLYLETNEELLEIKDPSALLKW